MRDENDVRAAPKHWNTVTEKTAMISIILLSSSFWLLP